MPNLKNPETVCLQCHQSGLAFCGFFHFDFENAGEQWQVVYDEQQCNSCRIADILVPKNYEAKL